MALFRLRYRSSDLHLSFGEFVIGRSSRCNLSLADALVSRRHAILHVSPEGVMIEDLGSRNGVLVNGTQIERRLELAHMDRLFIGAQEILFIDAAHITDRTSAERYVVCDSCGAVSGAAKRHCADCGRRLDPATGETSKDWSSLRVANAEWGEDTRPLRSLEVIGGIAAKAIKMGRFAEAERVILPHLDEVLERAMKGQPLIASKHDDGDAVFEVATQLALGLAHGPSGDTWIDWAFRFHTASERLMTDQTIDLLHDLVRKHGYRKDRYVRAYLNVLENSTTKRSAPEQFRIGRVESLMNVVSARANVLSG